MERDTGVVGEQVELVIGFRRNQDTIARYDHHWLDLIQDIVDGKARVTADGKVERLDN